MFHRSGRILILVVAAMLFANTAIACASPEIPSCFSSAGLVSGRPDYNFCRGQIQTYQDQGKNYIQCLQNDLNRSAEETNRIAQNYEWKKNEYETAMRNLNQAVNRLNQANAEYRRQQQIYESASQAIQQNLNAIVNNFNQMFGG